MMKKKGLWIVTAIFVMSVLLMGCSTATVSAKLTQTTVLTPTAQVSATSAPVPTTSGADRAIYVADVTIPDGTVIAPGAAFVKTWKLQNAGTTTWTTSYSLVFIRGDHMGTIVSV